MGLVRGQTLRFAQGERMRDAWSISPCLMWTGGQQSFSDDFCAARPRDIFSQLTPFTLGKAKGSMHGQTLRFAQGERMRDVRPISPF